MSLSNYIKETKAEMKHVSWPTKDQTTAFSIIVVAFAVFVGGMLGVFDFIFQLVLKALI